MATDMAMGFPWPGGPDLSGDALRDFQARDPPDFIAKLAQ
jgi:hypothetical protein